MPRPPRVVPPDSVVHLINRGNDRRQLFTSRREFEHFLFLMRWAKARVPLRLLAYVLMPNHWHLVAWPEASWQVSRYLQRLTSAHAARFRFRTGTVGEGHVYQDRFRGFIVDGERYYFRVLQYVEANPLRGGLVKQAQDWPWSSLGDRFGRSRGLIENGPLPLLERWTDFVNDALPALELEEIRSKTRRSHLGAWTRPPRKKQSKPP